MKYLSFYTIQNIIAEYKLNKKWPVNAINIAQKIFNIQEKMKLYSDDKYSSYWLLRSLLLQKNINLTLIKKNLYMRYGGDELAREILVDLCLHDNSQPYKILNAGSGFGSDLVEHAALLPNATFVGIELNKKYANLSTKVIQAFHLQKRIKIYCADLASESDINEIYRQEGLFDAAYSNLAILHIKDKQTVYHNILKLMHKNAKFRNEDYTKQNLTDLTFAENKIGCQNLKTPTEMLEIAKQAGFQDSTFKDLTDNWKEFTKNRALQYKNYKSEKNLVKENFLFDISNYFNNKNGSGGVFTHTK